MINLKVAILGATSHIAKGLIYNFAQGEDVDLHLYTRSKDKVFRFLRSIFIPPKVIIDVHEGYQDFNQGFYDVVINCVGVGTLHKLQGNYTDYFMVTEEYDNLVIDYLCTSCPNTLYICFSSGAVYGKGFSAPVEEKTANSILVNYIAPDDYYSIARLNSEAKHRAFHQLRIIDLRVFSYFSRFIDLADGYFITELLKCVLENTVFVTNNMNIVRDYVHPADLFSIINKCIAAGKINTAFDVTSAKPVEKNEILDYFSSKYGLQCSIIDSIGHVTATGSKNIYYSTCHNASTIGYLPEYSSMDSIIQETEHFFRVER